MKYRVLVSTLVLALATFGSVAVADTTQPTQIVTGKVISSTPTQLVVEAENGSRTTFVVDQSTMPSTIMVGDRVSVNYQSQAGGSFRATNVSATSLSGTGISDATGVNTNDTATNDAMAAAPATGSTLDSTRYPNEATTTGQQSSYAADSTQSSYAADTTLPATASNQPLILLLGLLALGGFLLRTVIR